MQIWPDSSTHIGLLSDTNNCGLRMRLECRERCPCHRGLSDPDMHHGTCVTHVPWCMPGSLTIGFLWRRRRGNRSRHSRCMLNPQFYVSDKRAINHWIITLVHSLNCTRQSDYPDGRFSIRAGDVIDTAAPPPTQIAAIMLCMSEFNLLNLSHVPHEISQLSMFNETDW